MMDESKWPKQKAWKKIWGNDERKSTTKSTVVRQAIVIIT